MKRIIMITAALSAVLLLFLVGGCDKERVVQSTEYVHDVQYIELPPDTIFVNDSVLVETVDTVLVHDTVTIVETQYDTTYVVDSVVTNQCEPNAHLAFAALQFYSDPLVIDYINQLYGYNDGWIFYLSSYQVDLTAQSSSVYDIYGYIDYWTADWSGFEALEYYWRLSYVGGDPADPNNWQLSEPSGAVSEFTPGIHSKSDFKPDFQALR